MFALERQTRNAGDIDSTVKVGQLRDEKEKVNSCSLDGVQVAKCIVQVCFASKDYKVLGQTATTLTKRRGQEKRVITAAIQEIMAVLEQIENEDERLELIETLRKISEGKMFVESER